MCIAERVICRRKVGQSRQIFLPTILVGAVSVGTSTPLLAPTLSVHRSACTWVAAGCWEGSLLFSWGLACPAFELPAGSTIHLLYPTMPAMSVSALAAVIGVMALGHGVCAMYFANTNVPLRRWSSQEVSLRFLQGQHALRVGSLFVFLSLCSCPRSIWLTALYGSIRALLTDETCSILVPETGVSTLT